MILPKRRRAWLLAVVIVFAGLLAPAAPAQAAPGDVAVLDIEAQLDRDGSLLVEQTAVFDAPAPAELTMRLATSQLSVGDARYRYQVSEITARAGSRDLAPQIAARGDVVEVRVPTAGITEPVTVSYRVLGATQERPDGTLLTWRLLQGLSVPVDDVRARVLLPGAFTSIDCSAGPPGGSANCRSAAGGTGADLGLVFLDGPRGVGEVLQIDVLLPPGVADVTEQIDYQWSVDRAFSADPLQLALALGLLLAGAIAVWVLHRRTRDVGMTSGEIIQSAEFAPVGDGESEFRVTGDVRPGEVGTMLDERVDPIDVVATVVDLAVRGHLLITELPARSAYASTDWTFTRRPAPEGDVLQPYEQRLLDIVAPSEGEVVTVSGIGEPVAQAIPEVQSELYDEMVVHGWYDQRPDSTRGRYGRAAMIGLIVAVGITVVLAAFTTFGLVGLALVAIALGLIFVAQEVPARTAKGTATLRGLEVLRGDLLTQATDRMRKRDELAAISKVLPYAIVLGGADRWVAAMVAADDDDDLPDPTDLHWYHAPEGWHLRDLPDSLHNFLTTLAGSLFAR